MGNSLELTFQVLTLESPSKISLKRVQNLQTNKSLNQFHTRGGTIATNKLKKAHKTKTNKQKTVSGWTKPNMKRNMKEDREEVEWPKTQRRRMGGDGREPTDLLL